MAELRGLDLSQEQRDQVRAIMERHREALSELRSRGRESRKEVHAAMQKSPVDEAAIRAAHSRAAEVQAEAAVLGARIREEVFGVLTPEQKEKAATLRAERDRRMQERQQRMQQRLKPRGQAQGL
jgi:protein CpxP